jgi:hypothetical protein
MLISPKEIAVYYLGAIHLFCSSKVLLDRGLAIVVFAQCYHASVVCKIRSSYLFVGLE